ncbi:MAG: deoxyribonuclease IV [Thermoguttaceae bacterium]|nr:deoxyribonuclease IV [Thermoguttaceae bacterium]MBR3219017.1 deoxyribonuclease IV [Thermoguttaceae bacterium]
MPYFGVHESIAGGFHQAVSRAAANGFDTVQIFSKNSNQWRGAPISDQAADAFASALEQTGLISPLIHDSYLINLASPKSDLLEKSIAAFADELHRAERLGIASVVTHPGSYTTSSEQEGIETVVRALDTILASSPKSVMVLLETTAGQGTNLGCRFEHLAEMIAGCSYNDRLGVCFDTCHVFASGYDFSTPKAYEATMAEFDRIIGIDRLRAFHLNDSVRENASRIDRHAHIGYGKIGREPFGFIVTDPRFAETPMYLETPKGTTELDGQPLDWDVVNLRTLRSLAENK